MPILDVSRRLTLCKTNPKIKFLFSKRNILGRHLVSLKKHTDTNRCYISLFKAGNNYAVLLSELLCPILLCNACVHQINYTNSSPNALSSILQALPGLICIISYVNLLLYFGNKKHCCNCLNDGEGGK